jgi:hypothetical protein
VRVVVLAANRQQAVEFPLVPDGAVRRGARAGAEVGHGAFAEVVELAVPFAALALEPGMRLAISVHVVRGEVEVERLPRYGFVSVSVPDADFEHVNWRV